MTENTKGGNDMSPQSRAEYLACLQQHHDQGLAAIKVVIRKSGPDEVNLLMEKFVREHQSDDPNVTFRGTLLVFALLCGLIAVEQEEQENQNEPTA